MNDSTDNMTEHDTTQEAIEKLEQAIADLEGDAALEGFTFDVDTREYLRQADGGSRPVEERVKVMVAYDKQY